MVRDGNVLEIGRARIGHMFDESPDTPHIAVMLARTEQSIELTVPILDGHSDVYQHWFTGGWRHHGDPGRSDRRYGPPSSVGFHGAEGSVGLVGCHVSGLRLSSRAVSEGRLTFDYTILGASTGVAFESINGFRSEVEGLGTWVGLRSLSAEQETKDGRLTSVSLRLDSPPDIPVARRLNAAFQANWRYGPGSGPDQTTITERMQIHTRVKDARDWDEHLAIHISLRNLLRVAAWRPLNFVSHEAMSSADPLRTLDGKSHGEQWLPVLTHRTGMTGAVTPVGAADFLFGNGDLGRGGVARWLQLSRRFERGLSSLVGLLELQGASLEAHLAQAGIGFESLGYDLLLERGAISDDRRVNVAFATQVEAVASTTSDMLPFPADDFSDLFTRTYRGVKHPNNARPRRHEMYLAYLQAIQVFRAWVAVRLGVSKVKIKQALETDRVTRRIRETSKELERERS